MNSGDGETYKGSVGKDKGPPGHLEGYATTNPDIFPERTDGHDEEPEGEAVEPETDEDADDLDDGNSVFGAHEVGWDDALGLTTEMSCPQLDHMLSDI